MKLDIRNNGPDFYLGGEQNALYTGTFYGKMCSRIRLGTGYFLFLPNRTDAVYRGSHHRRVGNCTAEVLNIIGGWLYESGSI
jgi:hypothetical protein